MNRLPNTMPVTLRFAYRAGEARMQRVKCMDKARLSNGRERATWAMLARNWNRSMVTNAVAARNWYEADLKAGKAL